MPRPPYHPGRKPSERRTPHYLREVERRLRSGGVPLAPGTVTVLTIAHDDWCQHWSGGACNCAPIVTANDQAPPDPESN